MHLILWKCECLFTQLSVDILCKSSVWFWHVHLFFIEKMVHLDSQCGNFKNFSAFQILFDINFWELKQHRLSFAKIDFTEILSCKKLLEFIHCEMYISLMGEKWYLFHPFRCPKKTEKSTWYIKYVCQRWRKLTWLEASGKIKWPFTFF